MDKNKQTLNFLDIYNEFNVHSKDISKLRLMIKEMYSGLTFLKETKNGTKFLFSVEDNYGIDFLFSTEKGKYFNEPFTSKLIELILKNNNFFGENVFICAGAYIGDMTIPAIKAGSSVFAFEPNEQSYNLLIDNLKLNNLACNCMKLGLSDYDGMGSIENKDASSTFNKDKNGKIQTTKIDTLLKKENIKNITLIQLDVEGHELDIINGGIDSIKKFSPYLILEIHSKYDSFKSGLDKTKLCQKLIDIGYNIYAIRDYNTHIDIDDNATIELLNINNVYLEGPHHGFNLFCYRGELPDVILKGVTFVNSKLSPKLIPSKFDEKEFRPFA